MSVYNHSNVTVTGGSSTYVAGNLNHVEVRERSKGSATFERFRQHVASNARHNSAEVSDQPKCHPGTRTAILDYLFAWAAALSYTYSVVWLHGPAGAGKSAILRTIAERLHEEGLLIAGFFFFRTGERGNTAEYFIATIAYQLALSIPETRPYIEEAIERDPDIFYLSLWTQAQALIVSPIVSVFYNPSFNPLHYPRIIVVDGINECKEHSKQCEILQVLRRIIESVPIPLAVLVASRPEHNIRSEFNSGDLSRCSSRLALDGSYDPDTDIRKYLEDMFSGILRNHRMKAHLSTPWPAPDIIDRLVANASGQFIYAATIDKFISSPRHNPARRLDIILGTLDAGNLRPFEQLDNLYTTIFRAVSEEDLPSALRILGVLLVPYADSVQSDEDTGVRLWNTRTPRFVERLLEVDSGEVHRSLFDLESLLAVKGSNEDIQIFHASLSDYLFDQSRSGQFWIDTDAIYSDLAGQYVRHLHTWPEIRLLFLENISLFFTNASPTNDLRKAVQSCNLSRLVHAACNSNPHALRDIYPSLLRKVIEESRFRGGKHLFAAQFSNFMEVIAKIINEVYFKTINLKSLIVAGAYASDSWPDFLKVANALVFSSEETFLEGIKGFNLLEAREFPAILPYIQSLLENNNSKYFMDGSQFADVVVHILQSLLKIQAGPSSHPFLLKFFTLTMPSLLMRCSAREEITHLVKNFCGSVADNNVNQVCSNLLRRLVQPQISSLAQHLEMPEFTQTRLARGIARGCPTTCFITSPSDTPTSARKRSNPGLDDLGLEEEATASLVPSLSWTSKRARLRSQALIQASNRRRSPASL